MKKVSIIKAIFLTLTTLFSVNFTLAQCWQAIGERGIHSVGIKSDGTLWTWGNNINGQLGDGTLVKKLIPTQIGTDSNWKQVTCGEQHTIALKTDGTLWAWGNNGYYQTGILTASGANILTPTQIGSDSNWAKIGELAYQRSYAIKTDGTLWAWGDDILGNNLYTGAATPIQIGSDTNWKDVSTGYEFTVALKTDGTLWSWGDDYRDALGNGSYFFDVMVPQQIGTATNWKSVSAGGYHVVATKTDGSLFGWGWNAYYQLGNNTITNSNSPIQIGTLTDWDTVHAGYEYSMAKKINGTIWSWGNNTQGQLGVSSYGYSNPTEEMPVQIGTASDWKSIGPGYNHTVALKNDGSLYAWGYGQNGSLGNGSLFASFTYMPVLINTCATLSLNNNVFEGQLVVYPNPSDGIFNIEIKEDTAIVVFDLLGKQIYSAQLKSGNNVVDFSNYKSGVYFLQVKTNEFIEIRKIIKN